MYLPLYTTPSHRLFLIHSLPSRQKILIARLGRELDTFASLGWFVECFQLDLLQFQLVRVHIDEDVEIVDAFQVGLARCVQTKVIDRIDLHFASVLLGCVLGDSGVDPGVLAVGVADLYVHAGADLGHDELVGQCITFVVSSQDDFVVEMFITTGFLQG